MSHRKEKTLIFLHNGPKYSFSCGCTVHVTYHKLYEVDVAIAVGVIDSVETYSSYQDMLTYLKRQCHEIFLLLIKVENLVTLSL
jgi:hypothetical protein